MRTLRRGDSGDEVRALQRILKRVGVFEGAVRGNFRRLTEAAVTGFQVLHRGPGGRGLPVTGVVTEATWWALQNLDRSRADPPSLRRGESGEAVKLLQRLLKARGTFDGAVRGNFRDRTERAVVAFQQANAGLDGRPLAVTGVVDDETWWALLHPAAAREGARDGMPTLRYGDRGPAVMELQRALEAEGAFKGAVKGNFLKLTERAVHYFQATHLGPDGHALSVDGIVGPATWWALHNRSGAPQVSDLAWDIPRGLTDLRRRQLEIVIRERMAGVREVPDGANWGGGIERYGGRKGQPWCCYFWSWGTREAFGRYPLGKKLGLCKTAWNRAGDRGFAREKGDYVPIPGDGFVMLYRNEKGRLTGRGHIGFVLRTETVDGRATAIDTVEGNAGNRVKVGHRLLSSPDIVGFINQFPDEEQPTDWQPGLGATDIGGPDTTR